LICLRVSNVIMIAMKNFEVGAGLSFCSKLVRYAMKTDTESVLNEFGKNEQVKKAFCSIIIALSGLVLAQIADPALAEKIMEMLMGI
jgi:hypothetical protein